MIKQYFTNYYTQSSDITVHLKDNSIEIHENVVEPWNITLADTGLNTNTAGRIMQIRKYLDAEPFMLTYGDGVADVNINQVIDFHNRNKKVATITAAKPAGRWGTIQISDKQGIVETFQEKNKTDEAWVNCGFAVFEQDIYQYLTSEEEQLEREPYERLVLAQQIDAYKHYGFWHAMDTVNDRAVLEEYWKTGHAPWKVW